MYTNFILLACRRHEWPTCPPLSAWTHGPAPSGCWTPLPGLLGMVPAREHIPSRSVLAGPGLPHGKSLGTGSHPVAQNYPWTWIWSQTQAMLAALGRSHVPVPTKVSSDVSFSLFCPLWRIAPLGEGCPTAAPGPFPHLASIAQEDWAALLFAPKMAPCPSRNHFSPHWLGTWNQGQSWNESFGHLCG